MEKKEKVICLVVGFLGLVSAALGFAAEGTRVTGTYPSNPVSYLALAAAGALVVAQLILSIITRCICCGRGQPKSIALCAVYCWAVSWTTFICTIIMLLLAVFDDYQGYDYVPNQYFDPSNNNVPPGYFAGAAVLSFATVLLGIVYYLALDSAKTSNNSSAGTAAAPNQGGIEMGHPRHCGTLTPQYPPP